MSEADVPYAMAIAIFAAMIGVIWGYRIASASNAKAASGKASPANVDQIGEQLSRTKGEYKDYRDNVDEEFGNINHSIKRLNAAYAALLDNFVQDAEKLCPDNQDALKVASNDRDLIAMDKNKTATDNDTAKSA